LGVVATGAAPNSQKSTAARDPRTPIGKTAKGELVYSLTYESLRLQSHRLSRRRRK